MTASQCPIDLMARRRGGGLTSDEKAELDLHVRDCETCALAVHLHEDFEHSGVARMGDTRLIARAVDAVMVSRRLGKGRGRMPSFTTVAVSAAVILALVSVASAGMWAFRRYSKVESKAAAMRKIAPSSAHISGHIEHPTTREAQEPQAPVPPPPTANPAVAPAFERARGAHVAATSARPTVPTQAEITTLFTAANESRRAGNYARARTLYRDLQRRFPATRETRLSFVSLGRVLLDQGAPGEALGQFDRYLAGAPDDVLAAEALYGRARALTALERSQEAKQSWNGLLSRFPDSVYADVARRQLEKLR